MFDFAAARFLEENFTDADGVLALCYRHVGTAPRREAVKKWFARGSISSEWWPTLLFVLEKSNEAPVSLTPYIVRAGGNDGIFA